MMPANPRYTIEARDLTAVLGGQKVLDVPSLQVLPNEVMAVIGPNGSGKTTLLLCLNLLLKPASGTIFYKGNPVSTDSDIFALRRKFATVFQEPLLLNTSVWENVNLGLQLHKINKDEARKRTQRWLERFGIAKLAHRQAKTLSGGEAKRVSLVRAFVLQPEVLFLDEPFNALDTPTRQALIDDFDGVVRETKVTTVMVTHDRNEALALAHRVVVLMDGKVRQAGAPQDIFSHPTDEQIASFVGVENIIPGKVVALSNGMTIVAIGDKMIETVSPFAVSQSVYACIRPEEVTLSLSSLASSARNCLKGIVKQISQTGALSRIEIDCGFMLVCLITKMSMEEMSLEKGKTVYATFKATGVHLIRRNDRESSLTGGK